MIGVIGIPYTDYWLLPISTIGRIVKAYRESETAKYRQSWEQTRMLAFYAANPETAKKAGKPDGLIKFPWERSKVKPKSLDEIRAQFEKIDKKVKQLNG